MIYTAPMFFRHLVNRGAVVNARLQSDGEVILDINHGDHAAVAIFDGFAGRYKAGAAAENFGADMFVNPGACPTLKSVVDALHLPTVG